jgi:hypothetical protein
MADKGIPVSEATAGTLDKIDMKQATNANAETVFQQRIVIAADETPALANPLPVQHGDGTNVMPAGDAAARAIIVQPARGSKTTAAAVSIGTTATSILAANTGRRGLIFYNNGSATVYLGGTGVTVAGGIPLAAGASFSDTLTTDAWSGIVSTGTVDLRVIEVS